MMKVSIHFSETYLEQLVPTKFLLTSKLSLIIYSEDLLDLLIGSEP